MKRPLGYSLLAVLIGVMSLGAGCGMSSYPLMMSQLQIHLSPVFYLLTVLQTVVGLVAAWQLWQYRPRAPELFAAWAALGMLSSVYTFVVVMPQMMQGMVKMLPPDAPRPPIMPFAGGFPTGAIVGQLGFYAILAGAAYWYLVNRRRPLVDPPVAAA